jgi:UDP-3-O-[3-hydroxymyristoyl] glucosamine N-acyltransferase
LVDHNFYRKTGPHTLSKLAEMLSCEFVGNGEILIDDISTLEEARVNDVSFFHKKKYLESLKKTKSQVILVDKNFNLDLNKNLIVCNDPYYSMAKVASIFYPDSTYPNYFFKDADRNIEFDKSNAISSNTFIHKKARIGKNCKIGFNSFIGPNVIIGDNCLIGDNVSIYFSIIGKNVKIYQGVRIGSEGFGFIMQQNSIQKIPQLGRVIIGDCVEIGANSTIDRGSIGDTKIGKLTMLDNLVHVAHNVTIGNNCIIAAMTGISGSTIIGNNVLIGGQVGISGHITIGNNVKIAAKSGIMKNIKDNQAVGGYPADNILDWHRNTLILKKLRKKNNDRS